MSRNKNQKKQIIVLISFIVIIGFLYSIRPITLKYGDRSIGFVTSIGGTALKGGKMKMIHYVVGDRIHETSTGQYFNLGDKVEVSYFKSLLWFKDGIVGEKVASDSFLVYSKNVKKEVKKIRVFSNNQIETTINVEEIKNFGCYVKNGYDVKIEFVYGNKTEKLIFSFPYKGKLFREI